MNNNKWNKRLYSFLSAFTFTAANISQSKITSYHVELINRESSKESCFLDGEMFMYLVSIFTNQIFFVEQWSVIDILELDSGHTLSLSLIQNNAAWSFIGRDIGLVFDLRRYRLCNWKFALFPMLRFNHISVFEINLLHCYSLIGINQD